jgi:alpha-tubulin suppressor-like RCC1 family protein
LPVSSSRPAAPADARPGHLAGRSHDTRDRSIRQGGTHARRPWRSLGILAGMALVLAGGALALFVAPTAASAPDAPSATRLISAGYGHTCAVDFEGKAVCWGANDSGESAPPDGAFTDVSAGGNLHSCGVQPDGGAVCWGGDTDGQASAPNGEFRSVSTGGYQSCGVLVDGTLDCWGNDDEGQATPPEGTFSAVTVGTLHACGLRTDGTLACWGSDEDDRATPPEGAFVSASAGDSHGCAIAADRTVVCWGSDGDGRSTPPDGTFSQVSAGYSHSCALAADGSVECWGNDDYGQATAPRGEYVEVSAGYLNSCALGADGAISCWGWDPNGQSTPPEDVTFGPTSVTSGALSSCAVGGDGRTACWGDDSAGQSSPPVTDTLHSVSSGDSHTCGLLESGEAVCWGDDSAGQLDVPDGPWMQLSAGANHTCALGADGSVACWGDDSAGQSTPPEGHFAAVSAGGDHTCALAADGSATCWGDDTAGQSTPSEGTFLTLSAGTDHTCGLTGEGVVTCWGGSAATAEGAPDDPVRSVSAGNGFSCAVGAEGEAVCWGDDSAGQADVPDELFRSLSSGDRHVCGVREDGGLACWGSDERGQASAPSGPGAPAIAMPIPDQVATEDAEFEFEVDPGTFIDPTQMTWSAALVDDSDLPDWLGFDPSAKVFRGTPLDADVGTYEVAVTVTDESGDRTTDTFTLEVANTNDPPQLVEQLPDQLAPEDAAFELQVPSTMVTDDDLDSGDTLAWTAALQDGSSLPAWLLFDPSTVTFSGTPTGVDLARLSIVLTVMDGAGEWVADPFQLDVTNTNDAPVAIGTLPDQAATEDVELAFAIPEDLFTDEDPGDGLTLSALKGDGDPLPGWLRFEPGRLRFTGTPTDPDVGTVAVQLVASDQSGATASIPFEIDVANTPDAPFVSGAVEGQIVAQGNTWTLTLPSTLFTDDDLDSGDALTITAARDDGTPLPAWIAYDPATTTFTGTPADPDVGFLTVVVTATDTSGASADAAFGVEIRNVNDPPRVGRPVPDKPAIEDKNWLFTLPEDYLVDDDMDLGDYLLFDATYADGTPFLAEDGETLTGWLAWDAPTRTFQGTPRNEDVGITEITVTATDASGASVADTFAVIVEEAGDQPTPPTVTPRQQKVISAKGAVPLLFDWSSGTEAKDGPPTYTLEVREIVDGAPAEWTQLARVQRRTSVNKSLPLGTLQLRLKGTPAGKKGGDWVEGEPFVLSVVDDDDPAVAYEGTWRVAPERGAFGGATHRSSEAGATATFTADARTIALLMPTGPGLGRVSICLDPGTETEVCRRIDLGKGRPSEQTLRAVFEGLAPGEHQAVVTVLRGVAAVDGMLTITAAPAVEPAPEP